MTPLVYSISRGFAQAYLYHVNKVKIIVLTLFRSLKHTAMKEGAAIVRSMRWNPLEFNKELGL